MIGSGLKLHTLSKYRAFGNGNFGLEGAASEKPLSERIRWASALPFRDFSAELRIDDVM
jgi:hypothetical protein